MKNLKDKTAVITGAGSGIGRSLALHLAEEGCRLAISDINKTALLETEELLNKKSTITYSEVLDVSDRKAMEAYPKKVANKLGSIRGG